MNKKFQYIFIGCLLLVSSLTKLNAAIEQAIGAAIIDDELQYKANSIIKNSFFSITLDNKPLKITAPKGLSIDESFLKPGSRPAWTHVNPNPTLKLYYNTPNDQTLVYEVKFNDDKYSNSEVALNEKNESFTFEFVFPNFTTKPSKNVLIEINLQTAITYSNEKFPLNRYYILVYKKP